jgi:hypothetical protein
MEKEFHLAETYIEKIYWIKILKNLEKILN